MWRWKAPGITLLGGDLMGIVRARKLARATLRNIKQNLFFAFAYNALGVPVAAGLLYPLTGMLLSPMIAAAAMSLSSVSVITQRAATAADRAVKGLTMSEDPNRWEGVYRSKEEAETSWFEDRPQVSLDLIAETGAGKDAAIVDVGRGLLEAGGLPAGTGVPPDHRARSLGNRLANGSRAAIARMRRSNGWWRTSCTGSPPAASTSGMIGPRSIS